ncbi:MAG: Fic family protein [Candidatus Nomurabacteria bacterium]|jgi:Fic family protein|nr:Fic family protein [Candidatus Nomurabacteria bacterium]
MKPFNLPKLPPDLNYDEFITELTEAHRALSRLDALLSNAPNPKIFERTFVTKEAVLSSKIEGTDATLDEVLGADAGGEQSNERLRDDIVEITNYRKALGKGLELLEKLPFNENVLKEIHAVLLSGGRGANRDPGNFRRSGVYIGKPGAGIENAAYVPPAANEVAPLITNLLEYIHGNDERDDLVRIAVAHYQFESIHPFLDGNGRVGRLMITLLLQDKDLLHFPYLYLSEYFERNRQDYYDSLRNVSAEGLWLNWVRYFLIGIREQATQINEAAQKVSTLYRELQPKFVELSREYGLALLDTLFSRPIFNEAILYEQMKLNSHTTGYALIDRLAETGFAIDLTPERKRSKRYEFKALLDIVRKPV